MGPTWLPLPQRLECSANTEVLNLSPAGFLGVGGASGSWFNTPLPVVLNFLNDCEQEVLGCRDALHVVNCIAGHGLRMHGLLGPIQEIPLDFKGIGLPRGAVWV